MHPGRRLIPMRLDRRSFLAMGAAGFSALVLGKPPDAFHEIERASRSLRWDRLAFGGRIHAIAGHFLGTPYVGNTLEGNPERCRVFLDRFDCVTLVDCCWGLARICPNYSEARLVKAVTQTRYRQGKVDGYWSRLHYTTDTLSNHSQARRLEIVSERFPGGVAWDPVTSYMGDHPSAYGASKADPGFQRHAREMEARLDPVRFKRIPKDHWVDCYPLMEPGDLLALCTTKAGLDFSHVGIYAGDGAFIHASSSQRQVVRQSLSAWGQSVGTCNGFVVSRLADFPL